MHRRRLLRAAAITALVIPPLAPRALAARQSPPATPEAGGSIARLPARVTGVDPTALLDALRTAPVTTPLLPADTPPVEPVVWDDDSDTDLQGTLGGVIFTTAEDEHGNPALIGTAIVHPDAESAAGVIASMGDGAPGDFLGLPWLVHVESGFAASVVQID